MYVSTECTFRHRKQIKVKNVKRNKQQAKRFNTRFHFNRKRSTLNDFEQLSRQRGCDTFKSAQRCLQKD